MVNYIIAPITLLVFLFSGCSNGNDFHQEVSKLDKAKPIFVYCHSGRRSAAAAGEMRSLGFKEVYELEGGIIAWRAAKLQETTKARN